MDDQPKFYMLTQEAKYIETALKRRAKYYQLHGPSDEIDNICTILVAAVRS